MSRYQVHDCYVVNSDDFGSLIAFASQLIFVLHNLIPTHMIV